MAQNESPDGGSITTFGHFFRRVPQRENLYNGCDNAD